MLVRVLTVAGLTVSRLSIAGLAVTRLSIRILVITGLSVRILTVIRGGAAASVRIGVSVGAAVATSS